MKKKKYFKCGAEPLRDDKFSSELKKQGKDGKLLSILYLRNPMQTYMKRVLDESIRY